MLYYLMHTADPIVVINIDAAGHLTDVGKECLRPELMPLRHKSQKNGLSRWWEERAVPASRHGMAAFFEAQGYNGPRDYLVKNLGLSLTDQYWIYPIDSSLSWAKINLYENDFRAEQLEVSADHPSDSVPAYTANSTLQGDIEKTWVIINGIRTLIKGNTDYLSSESLNEVLASEIYRLQGYDNYTPYQLITIKDKEYDYGCACAAFTSLDKEFVSAYDLITSKQKANDVSYFEHFVNLAVKGGADEEQLRHDLDMQILGDFVLSGYDRHLNNTGLIRDPKTLRFKRLAPVFDSGGALFAGKELPSSRRPLLKVKTNSFASQEFKMLSYVRDKKALDIDKLPSREWVRKLYERDSQQSEQRIEAVLYAYTQKIDILNEIQKGRDPFKEQFAVRER